MLLSVLRYLRNPSNARMKHRASGIAEFNGNQSCSDAADTGDGRSKMIPDVRYRERPLCNTAPDRFGIMLGFAATCRMICFVR